MLLNEQNTYTGSIFNSKFIEAYPLIWSLWGKPYPYIGIANIHIQLDQKCSDILKTTSVSFFVQIYAEYIHMWL